jgi:hypothetical protein
MRGLSEAQWELLCSPTRNPNATGRSLGASTLIAAQKPSSNAGNGGANDNSSSCAMNPATQLRASLDGEKEAAAAAAPPKVGFLRETLDSVRHDIKSAKEELARRWVPMFSEIKNDLTRKLGLEGLPPMTGATIKHAEIAPGVSESAKKVMQRAMSKKAGSNTSRTLLAAGGCTFKRRPNHRLSKGTVVITSKPPSALKQCAVLQDVEVEDADGDSPSKNGGEGSKENVEPDRGVSAPFTVNGMEVACEEEIKEDSIPQAPAVACMRYPPSDIF